MIQELSGTSYKNGITLKSNKWICKSIKDDEGRIKVNVTKNDTPITNTRPFLRGIFIMMRDFSKKAKLVLIVWLIIDILNFFNRVVHRSISVNKITIAFTLFSCFIFVAASIYMKFSNIPFYHGAEHKVINAYFNKRKLSVDEVHKESRVCIRCGTNVILCMLVFMLLFSSIGMGVALSFLLGIGISYEIIRNLSSSDKQNKFLRVIQTIINKWQCNVTTKEPSEKEIEVGLAALNELLQAEKN